MDCRMIACLTWASVMACPPDDGDAIAKVIRMASPALAIGCLILMFSPLQTFMCVRAPLRRDAPDLSSVSPAPSAA